MAEWIWFCLRVTVDPVSLCSEKRSVRATNHCEQFSKGKLQSDFSYKYNEYLNVHSSLGKVSCVMSRQKIARNKWKTAKCRARKNVYHDSSILYALNVHVCMSCMCIYVPTVPCRFLLLQTQHQNGFSLFLNVSKKKGHGKNSIIPVPRRIHTSMASSSSLVPFTPSRSSE